VSKSPYVAVVDYGLGNTFSVQQACRHVGLMCAITSSVDEIKEATAVILPGVGAFGDAMRNLRELRLVNTLKSLAARGKPLFGICLGMQLLMTRSYEFGVVEGLNLIAGEVIRFDNPVQPPNSFSAGRALKVPQVGWNAICLPDNVPMNHWDGSVLDSLSEGTDMYFVHSYYVIPEHEGVTLSLTSYGDVRFCSSLRQNNIFGCQFHPERSGTDGLTIYQHLADLVNSGAFSRERQM
jgi:glutamine amidotransferase